MAAPEEALAAVRAVLDARRVLPRVLRQALRLALRLALRRQLRRLLRQPLRAAGERLQVLVQ